MDALVTAPGVLRKSTRVFITPEDVTALMGCGKSKAYSMIREVNEAAKKKGNHPFPMGKANKYLFSDIFGIPMDEINAVINMGQGV